MLVAAGTSNANIQSNIYLGLAVETAAPTTTFSMSTGGGNDTVNLNGSFSSYLGDYSLSGGAGNDVITLQSISTGNTTINGDAGNDTVNVAGSFTFAPDKNFDADLQNDAAAGDQDQFIMNSISKLSMKGTGSATVRVSKIIYLDTASILTEEGNTVLEANQQAATLGISAGTFDGVSLINSKLTPTGSGRITIAGSGSRSGVYMEGADISSSASGLAISIVGKGGTSTSTSAGVRLTNFLSTGTKIQSLAGGDILISGTGDIQSSSYGVLTGAASIILTDVVGSTNPPPTLTVRGTIPEGSNFQKAVNLGTTITNLNGTINIFADQPTGATIPQREIVTIADSSSILGKIVNVEGAEIYVGSLGSSSSGITIGGGDINITAHGSQVRPGQIYVHARIRTDMSGFGGDITLKADMLEFGSWAMIAADATKSVSLIPYTPGRAFNLGYAFAVNNDPTDAIYLADSELDALSGGTINIGNATAGPITFVGAVTRFSTSHKLKLISGDDIKFGKSASTDAGSYESMSSTLPLSAELFLSPGLGKSVGIVHGGYDLKYVATTFSSGTNLPVSINGKNADSQYSRLYNYGGSINLTGLNLVLSGTYVAQAGDVFTIVDCSISPTSPEGTVSGIFNGLPDNSVIDFNGVPLRINYLSNKVTLAPVNNVPSLALSPESFTLPENANTVSAATTLATFTITDDPIGKNQISLTGPDVNQFQISGNKLQLKQFTSLNYELKKLYQVNVVLDDPTIGSSAEKTITFTLNIGDINEFPYFLLKNKISVLPESTDTSSGVKVADIQVIDDALGTNTLLLSGADAATFEIVNSELRLKPNTVLNVGIQTVYNVTVTLDDTTLGTGAEGSTTFTLTISDVNNSPTLTLTNVSSSIAENANTSNDAKVADIVVNDDALGTNTLELSGADAASFLISGNELFLKAGTVLNFETQSTYKVKVTVDDAAIGTTFEDAKEFTLTVLNINEAPTLALQNLVTEISENASTTNRIKLADIVITDDVLGINSLSISGPDASLLEITGSEIYLKAGVVLNYESDPVFDVVFYLDDESLGTEPEASVNYSLAITNINEAPNNFSLSLSNTPENVAAGTTVATLSTTDPDAADTFTYTLVTGEGDADNAAFTLAGNALKINASPDFETKSSYNIRLRTSDAGGLFFEQAFVITVTDVNETPTNIAFSKFTTLENVAANSTISTLSTTDPDASDSFIYSFVTGTGDTDNTAFTLTGNQLQINASPDYETKSSYNIRLRSTDAGGLFTEQIFVISVTNVNETPTAMALSASSTLESVVANSLIGTLSTIDPDAADTFTFTFATGTGDADNAAFTLTGNQLKINVSPDFETKSNYNLRFRSTDAGGLFIEQAFLISVTDVNDAPTDITLSKSTTLENVAANSTIGTLETADPDAADTFTYTFATGTGDEDNAAFTLSGNKLAINASPDFETKSSYNVRIRSTDAGGLFIEQAFVISVTNENEVPTNIALSTNTTPENVAANTTVGTLTTTDPDAADTFTYTFATGTGDADNTAFTLAGDQLKISVIPDYETKNSYNIRLRSTDANGLFVEQEFVIAVTDVVITNSKLTINTAGDIELNDLAGVDNVYTVSHSGGNFIIQDATGNADSKIDISAVPGATVDAKIPNKIYIPDAIFTTGGTYQLIINVGLGNDRVNFDANNSATTTATPTAGILVDLGSGTDTLATQNFIANASDSIWTSSAAQDGKLALGSALGTVNFKGLEHAVGGNNRDVFNLNFIGTNGIISVDGGDAINKLDTVAMSRGGAFVLSDTTLSIVPSAASQTAGQVAQTFSLTNIKRANLTGSAGNDSFNFDGWTQSGDGTLANKYGGTILAGGGTDTLSKKADLISGAWSDTLLSTSDGMQLSLSGNIGGTVQDKSAATPFSFDVSGLSRNATIIANKNQTDEIKINSNFFNVVLDNTFISVNQKRINLTGFNTSSVVGGTGSNNQSTWYKNFTWTGTQTFDGADGNDMVIVSSNQNLLMQPTLLTLGSATPFRVTLANLETFKYKAFDPTLGPSSSTDNTVTLSDWNGTGIVETGDGNDQLVVDKSAASSAQTMEIKPSALTLNGKVIQLISVDDAQLTGGTSDDTFSLSNWKGAATLDGKSGNNSLSIFRDRSQVFDANGAISQGKVTIKTGLVNETDKTILFNGIRSLTALGGDGPNTFTMNAGFGLGLTGFVLKGGNGNDTFDATSYTGNISVDGQAGDDIILAGSGNDTLQGGIGNDWISGGAGNDTLLGGNGRDVLVGGLGADRLNTTNGTSATSDADDDILIGGTTSYDTNKNAIAAIIAEWGKSTSFVSRVSKIKNTGTTTGGYKLTNLGTATVFDDNAVDTYFGGLGEDWIIKKSTETSDSGSLNELAQQVNL
jgi:hypothetical protein